MEQFSNVRARDGEIGIYDNEAAMVENIWSISAAGNVLVIVGKILFQTSLVESCVKILTLKYLNFFHSHLKFIPLILGSSLGKKTHDLPYLILMFT